MYQITTVVIVGELNPKWLDACEGLGDNIAPARFEGTADEILDQCRWLIPCVLVVGETFLGTVDAMKFADVVDFGDSLRVLVEVQPHRLKETERLIRMGYAGCIGNDCSLAQAHNALRGVLQGELWASRKSISNLLLSLLRESRHHLTAREREIARLLAEGLTNGEIGKRLFISPQTVRWHLRSLYSKLGTHDRSGAVIRSLQ